MFCCWDLIFHILFQIPQGSILEVGSWDYPKGCFVNMTFLLVMWTSFSQSNANPGGFPWVHRKYSYSCCSIFGQKWHLKQLFPLTTFFYRSSGKNQGICLLREIFRITLKNSILHSSKQITGLWIQTKKASHEHYLLTGLFLRTVRYCSDSSKEGCIYQVTIHPVGFVPFFYTRTPLLVLFSKKWKKF